MLPLITALSLTFATLCLTLIWFKRKYSFWKERGVLTPPVRFLWGNYREIVLQEKCSPEVMHGYYKLFKSKGATYGGLYAFASPIFMPVDLNLIKSILVTDFDHFVDRGFYENQKADPLMANIFTHEEIKWRYLRHRFTPAFSSSKLKMIFGTLLKCTEALEETLEDYSGKYVEIKELIARFSTNVIGSWAFGIECNCFKNPNNEFQINGATFFHRTTWENLKIYLTDVIPGVMKFFNVRISRSSTIEFFTRLTEETINYREKNNIIRKDFMHLLIQLKNSGKILDNEDVGDLEIHDNNEQKLSFEDLVGQAYLFFIAGFETPSNTTCFSLYFFSLYPEMQEKCRKEIEACVARHGGQVTYEAVSEMIYLDNFIHESMRFYPPVHLLNRICTKDYKVPGSDLVLRKGQKVLIPVLGIHWDEEYYPDPKTFDPERFSVGNSEKSNPAAFLPFGIGPKNCIGLRFGMVQVKTAIISILRKYEVSLNEKTKRPLEFDTGHPLTLCPKDGIWINLKKIEK